MQSLGIFGHSLGGATAAQFCHDDSRCKAAINIDGAPFGSVAREGLDKPFLFIFSDHKNDTAPEDRQIGANIQFLYGLLPKESRLLVTIRGANHFSFSDQIMIKSQHLLWLLRHLHVMGSVDGPRGLAITAKLVHSFFDVHLKNAPATQLEEAVHAYPEVQLDGQSQPTTP
jgi:pimeloyl-ACP methyl ester carboxylesterase